MNNIPELKDFLACVTPSSWIEEAVKQQHTLLIDHANCEKKAAAAALHLLHRYVEYDSLLQKMARLAREELLHFQKVLKLMQKKGVSYCYLSSSRYAQELRNSVRKQEPDRLIDLLIIGAFIEARSCERFASLAPYLDKETSRFYHALYQAEQRHYQDYLQLAQQISSASIENRVAQFREMEKKLIETPDNQLRFHSGVPVKN